MKEEIQKTTADHSRQVKRRQRAVRLTEAAAIHLHEALMERWKEQGHNAKLTREEQARLLGQCSPSTVDRILQRKGVDRNTLKLACSGVGLKWDDSLCEIAIEQPELCPTMTEEVSLESADKIANKNGLMRYYFVTAAVFFILWCFLVWKTNSPDFVYAKRHANYLAFDAEFRRTHTKAAELYEAGHYQEAEALARRAVFCARRLEKANLLKLSLGLKGQIAAAQGRLKEALKLFEDVMIIVRALDAIESVGPMLELIGDLKTRLGEYEEAEQNLLTSLSEYKSQNNPVGMALALRNLGTVAFETNRIERAHQCFKEALRLCANKEEPDLVNDIKGREALVLAKQGKFAIARESLTTCLKYWNQKEHQRWTAKTLFQFGQIAAMEGSREAAQTFFQKSRTLYTKVRDAFGKERCDQQLARLMQSEQQSQMSSY